MKIDATRSHVEILIVEDSPTQADHLAYILERHGYSFSTVRNGREALAAIAQRPPTLVISDVIMPEMDGYELCYQIKHKEGLKNIPVVLLTSLSDPADVMKGLESGADSFIFKPYDEQYLLDRVAYILTNQRLRETGGSQMGVEIIFAGRKFFITSDRLQILNLLLSTYEAAVQKNLELSTAQDELRHLNEHLESKVEERTAALEAEILERKQAEQKLQAQLSRLDLLSRTTRAIGEHQDLQSIFQVVLGSLEENLPIDFGCVCLNDQPDNALTVACVGARSQTSARALAMTEQEHIVVDQNGLARCMRGQLVYEPDLAEAPMPFPQRLAHAGLRALVAAPLLVESKVFGVLVAARQQPHSFSSGECEFLRQLSEHVALAAHQAQLYSALQQTYDDLRQTQQAVLQQERLRALGQMASGIAHDINNALSPVSLYAEALLERELHLSPSARNQLEIIQRAVDDVARTVSRMREFYRPRESQLTLTEINLTQLIQQVIDLTRARWSDMPQQQGVVISLHTDFAPSSPSIMGSEGEIRDALTNLILNAVDAMPEGGVLMLRTQAMSKGLPGSALTHVQVEVSDTGVGMNEETRRRCLEPFFTTKGERGTGLGLAMVYGMAQRHGVELEIESVVGQGTTLRLSFAVSTAAEEGPRPFVVQEPLPSRLHLLVVDDDPLLLKSLQDTLEGDGHMVMAANGGQRGIEVFEAAVQRGEPFAMVITDLGMPYIDGRRVAAAIKAAAPTTPVLLLTGWGERLEAEGDVPPHVDRVLSKPPKLRELRIALAELTASAAPTTLI